MLGQGSPVLRFRFLGGYFLARPSANRQLKLRGLFGGLRSLFVLIVAAYLLLSTNLSAQPRSDSEPLEMRLRVSWSSNESEQWVARIRASNGQISDVIALGFEEDVPGSTVAGNRQITAKPPSASRYGGVDFSLRFDQETKLEIQIGPESLSVEPIVVSALQLVDEPYVRNSEGWGHQLSISRAPGDSLVVNFERTDLVLETNEPIKFSVQPRLSGWQSRTANLVAKLVPARGDGPTYWTRTETVQLDDSGSGPRIPFEFSAPTEEGVYDLVLELQSGRYSVPFQTNKPISRRVQFVALSKQPIDRDEREFGQETYAEIDPLNASLVPITTRNKLNLGRSATMRTLGNHKRKRVRRGDRDWLQLDPGGWHAVPISFLESNRPVEIEFEYDPSNTSALGVSLVESNGNGEVATFGFDSGLSVLRPLIESGVSPGPRTAIHRFTVWPQGESGYLLFANRDSTRAATLSTIRLRQGANRRLTRDRPVNDNRGRDFLALIESPFFAESMGGQKAADPVHAQPLDDWLTFYVGADRLIQQLLANGYDGAIITVAANGSSLFPSELLQPTPRFDSGIFFSTGQDPLRKDILRMLFKMFERSQLKLIPALSLSSPLPELERLKQISAGEPGIDLVDFRQSWRTPDQGHLPRYNPLDVRVQKEVIKIVEQLVDRYAEHSSLAGVAVLSRPESYTLLPGREWCYDEQTVDQFFANGPIDLEGELTRQEMNDQLLNAYQPEWIQWRLNRITLWYQQIADRLRQRRDGLKLFMSPLDLHRNEELGAMLSPNLHQSTDFEAVLRWLGIDPAFYESQNDVVLLSPSRQAYAELMAATRIERHMNLSDAAFRFFHAGELTGDLFHHHSMWAHFAEFQEQLPFRQNGSALMRMQPLIPAANHPSMRFVTALQRSDTQYLVEGGWSLPGDLDTSTQKFMDVYRELPAIKFDDVDCDQATAFIRPVALRQTGANGNWYCYAVNNSPWPIRMTLRASGFETGNMVALDNRPIPIAQVDGKTDHYEFLLNPYEVIGLKSPNESSWIDSYRYEFPERAKQQLRLELQKLQAKLPIANGVDAVRLIENQDFELGGEPSLQGWMAGNQSSSQVTVDATRGHSNQTALKLTSQGEPVWIRSGEFRSPTTGRLSLSAWIRMEASEHQPPLRLAVEGRTGKRSYYRFGAVGSGNSNAKPITQDWQRFAVHFDDLPIEGMDNLRIGFDLMGAGTVWIDEVRTYDHWLDENDTAAMSQILAAAGRMLESQDTIFGCLQILEGYWPRFLDLHFGEPSDEDPNDQLTSQLPSTSNSIRASRKRRLLNLSPRKTFPFR